MIINNNGNGSQKFQGQGKKCPKITQSRSYPEGDTRREAGYRGSELIAKDRPVRHSQDAAHVRPSLETEIATAIQEGILDGEWKPGDRLVEMELAQKFGVSQGTIRGALKYLQADGLIEHRPRRGNFVITVSEEDIRDISLMRDILESAAAQLASDRITDVGRARLMAVVEDMRLASDNRQRRKLLELDLRFHRTVVEIAGSRMLLDIYKRLEGPALLFLLLADEFYEESQVIVDLHEPLLAAICSGDSARAHDLARRHTDQDAIRLTGPLSGGQAG
nr:GntR family transcriptional regulator [Pseudogemmobacter faecipullorum]